MQPWVRCPTRNWRHLQKFNRVPRGLGVRTWIGRASWISCWHDVRAMLGKAVVSGWERLRLLWRLRCLLGLWLVLSCRAVRSGASLGELDILKALCLSTLLRRIHFTFLNRRSRNDCIPFRILFLSRMRWWLRPVLARRHQRRP